jgi:hypothetical protein
MTTHGALALYSRRIPPLLQLMDLLVAERHDKSSLSPIAVKKRGYLPKAYRKNSFTFDSTVDQEAKLGLSVMVTFTVPPSISYLPFTPLPEKLPEFASPLKLALFSLATFLASDTSVPGLFVAFMLKVRPPPPPLADDEGGVFRALEEDPALPPTFLPKRRFGPLPPVALSPSLPLLLGFS